MGAALGAAARALGAAAGAAARVRRGGRARDGQAAGGPLPVGRRPRARRPGRGRGHDGRRAGAARSRAARRRRVEFSTRTAAAAHAARRPRRRASGRGAVAAGAGRRGRDRRAGHAGRRAAAAGDADADAAAHRPRRRRSRRSTTERIGDRPNGDRRASATSCGSTSANSEWLTLVSAESGKELPEHVEVGADIRALVADRDELLARARQHARRSCGSTRARAGSSRELPVPGTPTSLAVADERALGRRHATTTAGRRCCATTAGSGELRQSIAVREGIGGDRRRRPARSGSSRPPPNKLARLDAARRPAHGLGVAARRGAEPRATADGALWLTLPAEDAVAKVEAAPGRSVVGSAGRAPAQAVVAGGRVFVASRNDHTVVVLEPEALRPVGDRSRSA